MSGAFDAVLRGLEAPGFRLLGAGVALDAAGLRARVDALADALDRRDWRRVASRLDNGVAWVTLDLALRRLGGVHVPLPTFFSREQQTHALATSAAQCVVTDAGAIVPEGAAAAGLRPAADLIEAGLRAWTWNDAGAGDHRADALPDGTACVTYTSGTTGHPRGACLSADALATVAASLVGASAAIAPRRHLCLMPLGTLLENVAGLYGALLSEAELAVPGLAEIGYTGAAGLDVPTLLRCLHAHEPESVILVPQLLLALVSAAEAGAPLPRSLRYLAVGGAHVGPRLLARADALGLPVYEGYGLTECASVVCLNRPGAHRAGSVGRPLAHARVSVHDGELVVDGVSALGYLGGDALPPGPIRTGDLGRIDDDGFVHVTGRRKHVFITAFGRNVAPEWVESELLQHPLLAQAIVWGEARADNVAVVFPRRADASQAEIARALTEVNAGLPDYARVSRFVRAAAPFSANDGLLTPNGRPRRAAILARYQAEIDASYRAPAAIAIPAHAASSASGANA